MTIATTPDKLRMFFGALSLLSAVTVCSGAAWGADIYVGSVPELEIALDTAAANGADDTITLAAGTYNLSSSLSFDSQEPYSITIQGEGTAILEGGAINHRILFLRTTRAGANITIKNLTLQNGYAPEGENGAGLFINIASGDLLVDSIQIVNCFGAAFYFTNHGGGAYIVAGVGADVIIRNSIIAGNQAKGQGGGLYLGLTDGKLSFINNTLVNNTNKSGVFEGGGGMYLRLYFDTAVADIYNNVFWGNNYAYDAGDIYIEDDGDSSSTAATVNFHYNNYNTMAYGLGTTYSSSNNISQDPLFTEDFHLPPDSPCLDMGAELAPNISTRDVDGDLRIVAGPEAAHPLPDLGADEYMGPVPPGDLDCDRAVSLKDVVKGLKLFTGQSVEEICLEGGADGNGKVGMAEIVAAIRDTAANNN